MTDPYVYPGTHVLVNRFGITDPDQLLELERQITAWRMAGLPPQPISLEGYRTIHRLVFQELYEWAGVFRNINLAKVTEEPAATEFLPGPYVEINMRRVFAELEADNRLQELDHDTFAFRAAVYVADLNHIHPFREGNGRALRAFLKDLARQAGYDLDLRRVRRDRWIDASIRSHAPAAARSVEPSDYEAMTAVISGAVTGRARDLGR